MESMIVTLLARCQELEAENRRLAIAPSFNVLTRAATEIKWEKVNKENKAFVFFDIDNLHALNESLGYDEVNRRIDEGLSGFRRSELLGLVFSGDEFACVINRVEVWSAISRVRREMADLGITFTAAICPIVSDSFESHYQATKAVVTKLKSKGKRNTYTLAEMS